jgi:DNA-binding protein H-NS
LHEQVVQKRQEVKELEVEIAEIEKEQAKAFKEMLGANPMIRKMLNPKSKGRSSARRKKPAKAQVDSFGGEMLP